MATPKNQVGSWSFGDLLKSAGGAQHAASPEPGPALPHPAPPTEKAPVTEAGAEPESGRSERYYAIKTLLHQKVLARMDLAAAERMSPEQVAAQLRELSNRVIDEESLPINDAERTHLISDLQHEILGLGPLEPLLADPSISEIMVNGHDIVFIERGGRLQLSGIRFNDDNHLLKVIDRIVTRVGRRIDEASPMVDARLPDGSRVNAVIPPIALDGPSLSIRRFAVVPLQIQDLVKKRALTPGMAELLAGFVKAKTNILISGGTGSGKTTLLNILSGFIPEGERIITIEDTAELQLQQNHVVRLETRPPNIEGKGEISMRALVKNSLRMRPDRIILGEVRGSEVIDMLQAMNTGHDGSLTTIHANAPREALGRLENLVGMGSVNLPAKALRQQITSAINVIVQATRLGDGSRKITSILETTGMEGDVITTQEIFVFERTGVNPDGTVQGRFRATGVRPRLADKLKTYGISLPDDLFDPNRQID